MTNNKIIKLYSKDKKSLKRFSQLLEKIKNKWTNLTFVWGNIKKKRKKVSVLKSPHVNKAAQTQFQSITYGAIIKISSLEMKKNLILLKKIRNHIFPGIKIKIEQKIEFKKAQIAVKNQLLPKKIYYYKSTKTFIEKQNQKNNLLSWNSYEKNKKILLNQTLQFFKVLDHYGRLEKHFKSNLVQVAQLVRAKD